MFKKSTNLFACCLPLDKMNEDPGQVENSSHPGHDKQYVKHFYPKHRILPVGDRGVHILCAVLTNRMFIVKLLEYFL